MDGLCVWLEVNAEIIGGQWPPYGVCSVFWYGICCVRNSLTGLGDSVSILLKLLAKVKR